MLMGMSTEDTEHFLEKISAAAIVNQAVLKCMVSGLPVTRENVILMIGDYADPTDPGHLSLIILIQQTIDEVLAAMTLETRVAIH